LRIEDAPKTGSNFPVCFGALRTARPPIFPTGENFMSAIKNFLTDESGLELSEYAVAAALVAIGAVTAFTDLGTAIAAKLQDLKTKVKP